MSQMIFVHQAKTGGQTLQSALTTKFGKDSSFHDTDGSPLFDNVDARYLTTPFIGTIIKILFPMIDAQRQAHSSYKDRDKFKFIHGHMSSSTKYRKSFPNATYITLYRNPIQQFISSYHFLNRTPLFGASKPYHKALIKNKLSIKEFAELILTSHRVKKDASTYALKNFDLIGITEEYEATLKLLKNKFSPDLDIDVPSLNINPGKSIGKMYNLDKPTFEYLTHKLAPRLELYNQAQKNFYHECTLYNVDTKENPAT